MKALLTATALIIATASAQADSWSTPDKVDHFNAGRVSSLLATQVASKPRSALLGVAVGLGKEVFDAGGYGTPSSKDFLATAAGAFAGAYVPNLGLQMRGKTVMVTYTFHLGL